MKCANILIVQCIVDGNRNVQQKLNDFITLYEKEWSNIISTKARQIFYDSKFNKPVGIPNEENMFKLNKYFFDNETGQH